MRLRQTHPRAAAYLDFVAILLIWLILDVFLIAPSLGKINAQEVDRPLRQLQLQMLEAQEQSADLAATANAEAIWADFSHAQGRAIRRTVAWHFRIDIILLVIAFVLFAAAASKPQRAPADG